MVNKNASYRFWILVSIVTISGLSQGMLLPLIAIILEHQGVSSSLNGLNATSLYIGILLVSPFMEQPLRKFGYKPVIILGGLIVIISLAAFPLWNSFWFWFLLRLFIGVGDHSLHFATQTWITSFSSANKRGKNLSLYGLFYGVGFATGPLITPLVTVNEALPFIVSSALCILGWIFVFTLKNEYPEQEIKTNSFSATMGRFSAAFKLGWAAFLPPLAYGVLESSLNASFPIYALRIGYNVENVSFLLASFAIGAIVFQLPLGIISDKLGRRKVLIFILFFGVICFTSASFIERSLIWLEICLFVAGMFVGSTFSLGISYMADLMTKNLFPTGNLLCGMFFSLGSLLGPSLSGIQIQYFQHISFFYLISSLFLVILLLIALHKEKSPL